MSKHTKEPWVTRGTNIDNDESYASISKCYSTHKVGQSPESARANAKRIVSCVNACKDIEDPTIEIPKMRDEIKMLRDALSKAHELIEKGGQS